MRFSPAFRKAVSEPLEGRLPGYDCGRVEGAYQDVANLLEMIHETAARRGEANLFEAAERRDDAMVWHIQACEERIATLQRSIMNAAVIFLHVFLHELFDRPEREVTIRQFVDTEPARTIDEGVLLRTYCLSVFRNKLVAHHDVARMNARTTSASGERRQAPLPIGISMPDEDADVLRAIQQRTWAEVPEVADEKNSFNLLQLLFERTPVHAAAGGRNADRAVVDTIAGKGGVRSPTHDEVVATIDRFSAEVVAHVEAFAALRTASLD